MKQLIILFLTTYISFIRVIDLVDGNNSFTPTSSTSSSAQAHNEIHLKQSHNDPFSNSNNKQQKESNYNNKCLTKATCKTQRQRRTNIDGNLQENKRSCYCDSLCEQYDDCCADSSFTKTLQDRQFSGRKQLDEKRNNWHCLRVNPIFGDILIKATCSKNWNSQMKDRKLSALIERRCRYVKDRGKSLSDKEAKLSGLEYQSDPVGMMLPITDLTTNITYANSYCLRCNQLKAAPKLIYWSPLIECNYNKNIDDRNALFDLIRNNEGQALQFSAQRNSWAINASMGNFGASNNDNNSTSERLCSILPTIPESIEHLVRYCESSTIDRCSEEASATQVSRSSSSSSNKSIEEKSNENECNFGHQAIVYGDASGLAYFNSACAKCNKEILFSCERRTRKIFKVSRFQVTGVTNDNNQAPEFGSTPGEPGDNSDTLETDHDISEDNEAPQSPAIIARGGNGPFHSSSPLAGSFSLLMDLSGLDRGNDEVGSIHQCKDSLRQVYDPFHLACRDIICGFEGHFIDGACVRSTGQQDQLFKSDLVAKFSPTMSMLTSICLPISIASLALYLLLYLLSMFDLRNMLVDMARAEQRVNRPNSPLDKPRDSRTSTQSMNNPRAQSLSSRGLACLASSLLAAYLLFMFGQQPATEETSSSSSSNFEGQEKNPDEGEGRNCQISGTLMKRSSSCLVLAVATYYCFLLSFNWMFLLSYDIWRTLRLATCQLRAPALHGQSSRFIVYAIYSITSAALVVGLAVAVDLSPLWLNCASSTTVTSSTSSSSSSSSSSECSEFSRLILTYRPKFGHLLGSCWFSNKRALALFFGFPISLIILLNLLFFLHSSFMVIRTSSNSAKRLAPAQSPAVQTKQHHHHHHHPLTTESSSSSSSSSSTTMGSSYDSASTELTNCSTQMTDSFAKSNSLTGSSLASIQTLQSQLISAASNHHQMSSDSSDSSGGEDSPRATNNSSVPILMMMDPLKVNENKIEPKADGCTIKSHKKRVLEPSKSSSSLGNQSVGGVSIATSLAQKYDSHMHSLSGFMSSIAKDYQLYCRLSIIMGLTWLTGLVASLVDESEILWYLFVVLNTLQGLFIFIAFGCKRSKLANLQILADYALFKLRRR